VNAEVKRRATKNLVKIFPEHMKYESLF